jgi:osmotically-inducible protein OsmY
MNKRISKAASLAIALALQTLQASAQAPPLNIILAQAAATTTGRQATIDQEINTRVQAALKLDSELKTQTILVDVGNGSVRLTGQVTSASNYDRVKDVVGRVQGVTAIDNQLTVKPVTQP